MMGALRELSDMVRDYGLGNRYFLLTGGLVAALMLVLFLWGTEDQPPPAPPPPVPSSPAPSSPQSGL